MASLQQSYEREIARIGRQPAVVRGIGSAAFVVVQALIFAIWIGCNLKWIPGAPIWDSHLVILALVASIEAVFLVLFMLMAQKRAAAAAERRAKLELQIDLLAEQDRTKLMRTISAIAKHLNIDMVQAPAIELPRKTVPKNTAHEDDEFVGPADEF